MRNGISIRDTSPNAKNGLLYADFHKEGVEVLDPDMADSVVNYWINELTVATGNLIRTGAAELLASEPKLSSKIDVSIFQSI